MNAEQFLNEALGGNMNISTLKPLAWHKIMESYAQHKIKEVAHSASDNSAMDAIALLSELIEAHNNGLIVFEWVEDNIDRINAVLAQHHHSA